LNGQTERERPDEAIELVGHTAVSSFLGGLSIGLAVFADSGTFRWLCTLAAAMFLWLGYHRPTHANPTRRIQLLLGGMLCVGAGVSARWLFAANGVLSKLLILAFLLPAGFVGYFILLSRQGSIFRGK
jgi:hypothetical protein